MEAGLPPDPGKRFLTNINAQGQVTLTLNPSHQHQAQNDLPAPNAGVAAVAADLPNGSSSSITDALPISTGQGIGTPTLSHLPVERPPATQLSPSAPTVLSDIGTQVSIPSQHISSPGSSSQTFLATSSATSNGATSSQSALHSTATPSISGSTTSTRSSSNLPTTTSYATSISVALVSARTSSTSISSQTRAPGPTSTPARSSTATTSTAHNTLVTITTSSSSSPITSAVLPSVSELVKESSPSANSSSSAPSASTSVRPSSSVIPASAQSNLNAHESSFYIGISLGVIAAVAFIVVLLAWCLRLRRHSRRRRVQDTVVPWASPDEEEGGAPSGGVQSGDTARNWDNLQSFAHMRTWEPRGDRDVGEPRRAYGQADHSMHGISSQQTGANGMSSDVSLASSFASTAPLRPRNTLRQLPSHLVNTELAARGHDDGYFRRFHRKKTADMDPGSNPYFAHQTTTTNPISGPPADEPSAEAGQRSLVDRLRKAGKAQSPTQPQWDRLPTPGKDQQTLEFEPWAASVKMGLANAFNAIAAGLTSSSNDDNLTAAPSKHNLQAHRADSRTGMDYGSSDNLSKGWTLEEKDDGSGVVHFLPSLEKHRLTKGPPARKQTLSFTDGETISTYDAEKPAMRTISKDSRDTQIPLIASSAPAKAVVRGDQESTSTTAPLSRQSSVYSTVSARSAGIDPRLTRRTSRGVIRSQ